MQSQEKFRFRKATDIDRAYATFELMAGDVAILDVGFSDDGVFEVAFNEAIVGMVIDWVHLQDWIERGKRMAEADRS